MLIGWPAVIVAGVSEMVAVGGDGGSTVRITVAVAE
jgi:hypothetical protein